MRLRGSAGLLMRCRLLARLGLIRHGGFLNQTGKLVNGDNLNRQVLVGHTRLIEHGRPKADDKNQSGVKRQ